MIDLRNVLKKNPEWENDIHKLKAALCDLFPNDRREINLIIYAMDCGVSNIISRVKVIDDVLFSNLISMMYNSFGTQSDMCELAISAWANAYGVPICISKPFGSFTRDQILAMYFSEDKHIFKISESAQVLGPSGKVKDLHINTKYLIIGWREVVDDNKRNIHNSIFGYKYFYVSFEEISNNKIVFQIMGKNDNKPYITLTIDFNSNIERKNFILFLECLKEEVTFEYPFDDTSIPQTSIRNPESIWNNYFSGNIIKPISFKARHIKHSENALEIHHEDNGICEIEIGMKEPMSYYEAVRKKEKWLGLLFQ